MFLLIEWTLRIIRYLKLEFISICFRDCVGPDDMGDNVGLFVSRTSLFDKDFH